MLFRLSFQSPFDMNAYCIRTGIPVGLFVNCFTFSSHFVTSHGFCVARRETACSAHDFSPSHNWLRMPERCT